jgi:hypothetical protein
MTEGDYYPHLRYCRTASSVMEIRSWQPMAQHPLDQQAQFDVCSQVVPSVKIEMPEADWESIMEIYKSHFHAENQNPGVQAAWEQYKIMCGLTR